MSKFARGFSLSKSYDSWPFPFTDTIGNDDDQADGAIYFIPPINANSAKKGEVEAPPKANPKKKPVSTEVLKREYAEYIQKYKDEVAKFHELEKERQKLQEEIDNLQSEVAVLEVENKSVQQELQQLGITRN